MRVNHILRTLAMQLRIFSDYWLRADRPTRFAANMACVDFSVAKDCSLRAYLGTVSVNWNDKTALPWILISDGYRKFLHSTVPTGCAKRQTPKGTRHQRPEKLARTGTQPAN